ncbi:reverse transcriptase domain-containing protein [Streptomyces sp. NPDC051664]|uniref:reverse transcriptase domain-containing protein n=1 Tax=Streptomyces sp. NPDC051664 TaxID=3365668 RepID=UPI00378B55F0
MNQTSGSKSFEISKHLLFEAYLRVKANKGTVGVNGESIEQFEAGLKGNPYKLGDRMSSGCYFPPPVKMVEIDKPGGRGVRVLGVPTVADRIAQTVVAMVLEPLVEHVFQPDSCGYRPRRSALDAVAACRERCWKTDRVIDLDIRGFFVNLDHDLVLKAVGHHTDQRWVLLYVERWLKAPLQRPDGSLQARDRGSPQGSAVSPVLSNLFMHYASDVHGPGVPPVSGSSGTATTCWSTAPKRFRRIRCVRPSPGGWPSAEVWSCIPRRPALCIHDACPHHQISRCLPSARQPVDRLLLVQTHSSPGPQ